MENNHAAWSYNGVIYEVNVRQYTPEGTFAAFLPHLDRLSLLGVDILWFMPIFPIGKPNRKGTLGSYYSISDYTAVNPEFGSEEDFKAIITRAHALGMKVILDMVTNHTAWDAKWIEQGKSDYYDKDEQGNIVSPFDWSDTAKLNYSSEAMRREMTDSMAYWIKSFDIDGFREDMAGLVPFDYWQEAVKELRELKSDLFMLGEVESPEYHTDNTFDVTYDWEFHHLINRIAQGHSSVDDLRGLLAHQRNIYKVSDGLLRFTSNHDENSWNGSEMERMGDAHKCLAALTYVLDGMPLIYSGQEAGSARRLEFFEKDLIDWSGMEEYTAFYRELNGLKHTMSALQYGGRGAEVVEIASSQPYNIFAIKRIDGDSSVIAIFNLSPHHIQPAFYDGDYSGRYYKLWHGQTDLVSNQWDPFSPWEFKIYYKLKQ